MRAKLSRFEVRKVFLVVNANGPFYARHLPSARESFAYERASFTASYIEMVAITVMTPCVLRVRLYEAKLFSKILF